ncbi:Carbonyl reductase [NADPH] 3 [Heterocephalus glaber]|uniref:carbonyl reductase (NADPH) n=1 Tax=Heterocephalus glaber TaxID=10181 RepID=G5B2U6_HETGA|nr:Carbonyl reductase [NADPH] 3 [Heterocephalus glaber]
MRHRSGGGGEGGHQQRAEDKEHVVRILARLPLQRNTVMRPPDPGPLQTVPAAVALEPARLSPGSDPDPREADPESGVPNFWNTRPLPGAGPRGLAPQEPEPRVPQLLVHGHSDAGRVHCPGRGPRGTHRCFPAMSSCSRVALVTGADKGIGFAITRELCRRFSGDVVLTARDEARGRAAVQLLQAEGLQLDIDDLQSIRAVRDFLRREYGGLNVLVNNAGIAFKVDDPTPFDIQAEMTLKTNFFSTRNVCTELLPIVKPHGRVVNISSLQGSKALEDCSESLRERLQCDALTEGDLVDLMKKWVRTDVAGDEGSRASEQGAETPVYLALLPPDATEPHGQLICDKVVQHCGPIAP